MASNPLTIDPSTINCNVDASGFSSDYIIVPTEDQPSTCQLVPLILGDLNLPDTTLTTPNTGCKFTFEAIVPPPPVFVPKPNIPVIPCPLGTTISGSVEVIGTGMATGSGIVEIIGGPCNYVLGGQILIDVPKIPCPTGMSFGGAVTIKTTGVATGGGTIELVGGPCNYELLGDITINVPAVVPVTPSPLGGGDFNSCPNPTDMTVSSLIVDNDDGSQTLNLPSVCTNCDSSLAGPFTITDPDYNTLKAKIVEGSSCCAAGVAENRWDLCNGVFEVGEGAVQLSMNSSTETFSITDAGASFTLNLGDPSLTLDTGTGDTITMDPVDQTIVIDGDATVTLDATAVESNNVYFQKIGICQDGNPMYAYVLMSDAFAI
jgi:hypothetical protein